LGDQVGTSLTSAKSAAIGGVILSLPFLIMFTLLVVGVEPPTFGPLEPFLNAKVGEPNVVGSAVIVGAWLLAFAAFVVNAIPVVRDVRAGRSVTAHGANLLVAAASFSFVAAFLVAIVADQYPCWIGVPNCD
jgi:hypothetical protein